MKTMRSSRSNASLLSSLLPNKKFQRRFSFLAILAVLSLTCLDLLIPSSFHNNVRSLSALSFRIANNIADVTAPVQYADTAVYWHIHKAGGTSMKRYYSCLDLVEASQMGVLEGHENDKFLKVWEDSYGNKYVNVDTTKEIGILRAKTLNLAQRHLADVVFVTFPALATHVFGQEYKGRFFTLFRHPIERAVSEFYYRQVATWEPTSGVYDPTLKDVTIEDWLKDDKNEAEHNGNFMTAKLTGKAAADLTPDDLEAAKHFLRTKFLIGLVTRMEESVDRFDTYFNWMNRPNRGECREQFVKTASNQNNHQGVPSGSEAWNLLAEKNDYDLQLYRYAVELFEEQSSLFPGLPLEEVQQQQEEEAQAPPPQEPVVQELQEQQPQQQQPNMNQQPDSATILQLATAAYDNVPQPQQEPMAPQAQVQQAEAPPQPQGEVAPQGEAPQVQQEQPENTPPAEQQQQQEQQDAYAGAYDNVAQQEQPDNIPQVQQQQEEEQQDAYAGAYDTVPSPQEEPLTQDPQGGVEGQQQVEENGVAPAVPSISS